MIIAGAGGFARETLELILQADDAGIIYFYDDVDPALVKIYDKYEVLKTSDALKKALDVDPIFCVGVGGVAERRKLHDLFVLLGGTPVSIFSPLAIIGENEISIGEGSIIATGTVITTNVTIGIGCLINLNCTIGHDSVIGEFCEFSPGVHVSGNCTIGNNCAVGTGAVLLPGISLGNNVVIGAGAVVTKNVPDNSIMVGIPARPLDKK